MAFALLKKALLGRYATQLDSGDWASVVVPEIPVFSTTFRKANIGLEDLCEILSSLSHHCFVAKSYDRDSFTPPYHSFAVPIHL